VMAWHIGRSDVGHAQSSIWGEKSSIGGRFALSQASLPSPAADPPVCPFCLCRRGPARLPPCGPPRETCLPDFRVAIPEHRWILGDNRFKLEISCSQG
jgi:hypothetical protein